MSPIEWVATGLGVLCVALGVRRSVWTFPTAIGSVALLGIVVWRQRLYSDALLQGFFIAANLYGWAEWRGASRRTGEVTVERMRTGEVAGWALAGLVATALWGGAMATLTDAAFPWWDAGTAVASVVAQLLMARRRLENWAIWVAVDVALIPLYLVKGLPMIAALYVLYLALSLWGLIDWHRVARRAGSVATEPVPA